MKVQKDGGSLVVWQVHHGATQILPLEPSRVVAWSHGLRIGESHQVPPLTSADFPALVRDDTYEPWLKGALIAKVLQVPPCA